MCPKSYDFWNTNKLLWYNYNITVLNKYDYLSDIQNSYSIQKVAVLNKYDYSPEKMSLCTTTMPLVNNVTVLSKYGCSPEVWRTRQAVSLVDVTEASWKITVKEILPVFPQPGVRRCVLWPPSLDEFLQNIKPVF